MSAFMNHTVDPETGAAGMKNEKMCEETAKL